MADTPETTALPSHLYACSIRTDDGSLTEGDPASLTAKERDETIEAITDALGDEDGVLKVETGGDIVLIPVRKINKVYLSMVDEGGHPRDERRCTMCGDRYFEHDSTGALCTGNFPVQEQ